MSVASRFESGPAFAWFWELLTKIYRLDHTILRIITRWEALMILWSSLVIFGLQVGHWEGGFGFGMNGFFFPEFKVDTLGD